MQERNNANGDLNGRTGSNKNDVIGQYGEETINVNGIRSMGICKSYNLQILNGLYQHKNIHKYIWHELARQLKSIIVYVIVKQISTLKVNDVRVYRGVERGSDHFLLRANIHFSKVERNK